MNTSTTIAIIASALTKAQGKIGAAVKDARNPFFKSKYADLGSVMEACKQPLLEQGISVLQLVGMENGTGYLETVLLHESGEFISDRMPLVCAKPHDPQAFGSAITYARRYALQSALFIPAEDDDAENAMKPTRSAHEQDEAIDRRESRREMDARTVGHEEPVEFTGDWRDVICTYGKKDGPLRGKKLGELNDKNLDFLTKTFGEMTAFSPKDRPMVEALKARWGQRPRNENGVAISSVEEQANRLLQVQRDEMEAPLPF